MRRWEAPPFLRVVAVLAVLTATVAASKGHQQALDSASMNAENFIFTQPQYNGSIYENSIGKVYIQTSQKMGIRTGYPSSINIEFTIVSGDPHNVFIAETTHVKDFCFLRIRIQTSSFGNLNRELNSMFFLQVRAKGSYPGEVTLETFTNVTISVLDVNEFSPMFSSIPYEISIPEDTPLHSSIGEVRASDADSGINGEIYYSLVQATLVFAIHPTTGVISLSRPVRYENKQVYELDILAEDRGVTAPGRISPNSKTKFKINILPVNYNSPVLKVHNHQTLIENGNTGTIFAVLTVTDDDRGKSGVVNNVTITNDPKNIFRLVTQSARGMYNIVVASPIDRETTPENYNITVMATDSGEPPRSTSLVIPVRVQDVNDNAPEFEQNVYTMEVSEVVPHNTPVLFVKAFDNDIGSNAEVLYSIVDGNKKELFSIDPVSGLIRTSGDLDAEIDPRVILVVQAQDQANTGSRKTGQAKVIINLIDYNDNAPDFNKAQEIVTVRENLPKGSRVVTVSATDEDSGDNGKLSYSIVNYDKVPFEIDAFSGEITTTEVLDYETMRRSYQLHLRVSDWGSPYKREEEMVQVIRVEDINDNAPLMEQSRCSGYLSRDSPLMADVVTLSAIDFDSGNLITYSITDGNEDDCFSIGPSSGIITVNCDVARQTEGKRSLQVVASDSHHVSIPALVELTLVNSKINTDVSTDPTRVTCVRTDALARYEQLVRNSSIANLDPQIVVLNRNNKPKNNPPVVSNSFIPRADVYESAPVGTAVLDFGAFVSDPDSGYDGQLKYVISGGDDHRGSFKLDSFTGKLVVFSGLDYELKTEYSLTLTATDMGQPSLSVSVDVKINIRDENDNVPMFEQSVYVVSLKEDALVDAVVIQVQAKDLDTGDNADIRYSIISDDRDFYIDPLEGIVKVKRNLDRDSRPYQTLVIRAEDYGLKTRLASTTVVNITIEDVNDNQPIFVPGTYHVRVREDLPVGTIITTLTAHDLDEGENGRVEYSFAHGIDNFFEIDSLTGSVRIKRKLDYETKQVYNITGVAQDGGQPALTSICYVSIEVMDVNENMYYPVFPDFLARGSVSENLPIGSYVMYVQATDRDGPSNGIGQVFYTILDGSGLGRFTIDINGTIRTSQVLDRETTSHYWLTVVAQDRALVPKFARVEVLIEVEDANDNIPQSVEPVYYAAVEENKKEQKNFIQIQATDGDYDGAQSLTYAITGGNQQNFFVIDPRTGQMSTTSKTLDREAQEEHALEVTITDNGTPALSSTTRIIVKVVDDNDNRPEFIQKGQRVTVTVFAAPHTGSDLFVYRAYAFDRDEGRNANLTYEFTNAQDRPFRIDRYSGKIYATADLVADRKFEMGVRATDSGATVHKNRTQRLIIEVKSKPTSSRVKPRFRQKIFHENIPESDPPGQMVIMVSDQVEGESPRLSYAITAGNDDDTFTILPDHGSIYLAEHLDYETRSSYNLTISVTDGLSTDYAQLDVTIVDGNDNEPIFTSTLYRAEISENAEVGTYILTVTAKDADSNNRLLYSITSAASTGSLEKFHIGEKDGVIVVDRPLDREDLSRHLLTVQARDQGFLSKRSFARVEITLTDHNDHVPQFLSEVTRGQVYESAAVGTSVVQVMAVDSDKGLNAELTYSILSGNADSTFSIDNHSGIISVAKELNRQVHSSFEMLVSATDMGEPPLSSTTKVEIAVTISTNSPPKFLQKEYSVELQENLPSGTVVTSVIATSLSTVVYAILRGDNEGFFNINPNSGVIFTLRPIDYEKNQFFNLTVMATNIVSASQSVNVIVHIVDVNDNAPVFIHPVYVGNISESALQGSMVLDSARYPLVVQAKDADSNNNARLYYQIVGHEALKYFAIDPNTGAIRTMATLDYETRTVYNFSVQVTDLGVPQLQAFQTATVVIYIEDVNDNVPRFSEPVYQALLVLPTYYDVAVIQVMASDPDTVFDKPLSYGIINGNDEAAFEINSQTGVITVQKCELSKIIYELSVQATDGKFTSLTRIFINVQQEGATELRFVKERYSATVPENSAKEYQLVIIQPVALKPGQHVTFTLLNNRDLFSVGQTSGVLSTNGLEFDRERKDNYTVVVKVQDSKTKELSAHVVVQVLVQDENDNPPMFLNLPYHCTVSADAESGKVIQVVRAVDPDIGMNGEIKYVLAESYNNKFAINPYTREIVVKNLDTRDHNKEIVLKVLAEDKGSPSLTAVAAVHVHITDSSSPLFEQPVYEASVLENAAPHSPVMSAKAISPHGQKLIYSISRGDKYGDFALSFNTDMETLGPYFNEPSPFSEGYLSVVGNLDYEDNNAYTLTIRASDVFTGSYAEATVNVKVEDVNDNPPVFGSLSYTHTLSESASIGSRVLTVNATDADSGANALVYFSLAPVSPGRRDLEHFQINTETGEITLKKILDHEVQKEYKMLVVAKDNGKHVLSSTALVTVKVLDLNDNPPSFTQPSYDCYISDTATRGHLVFKVIALDPDESDADNLFYSIVGGNDKFTFSIDANSGIISLSEQRVPALGPAYTLNVSVTDGVYTSFTRVTVDVRSTNHYTPKFVKDVYYANVSEGVATGTTILTATAVDKDRGNYGLLTYSIVNTHMAKIFSIDADTGEISTRQRLDREKTSAFNFTIAATDNGSKMGFARVVIRVTDENDNMPMFSMHEYKFNVARNATVGSVVLKVKAEDKDEGDNAKIVYSLLSGDDEVTKLFELNTNTGEITTKVDLSVAKNNTIFQFFVKASDLGDPAMVNTVSTQIQIIEKDDRPPRFAESTKLIFVHENEPIGTTIATLKARNDSPLIYSIISGAGQADLMSAFTIDSIGQLLLSKRLDREVTPTYNLYIMAQTKTMPPLLDYMEINIQVQDVNDNRPEFACNPYTATIAENAATQQQVIQLQATDLDLYSKPLKYFFGPSMSDPASIFGIDSETGWITLLTPLDRETQDQYNLTVIVSDTPGGGIGRKSGEGVSLTSTTSVLITISDSNDNPPRYERDAYTTAVNEGALPGTVLVTLVSKDADSGINAEVTYYITEGDQLGQFDITKKGELLLNKQLDRETRSQYRLRVAATDGAYFTYATVIIDVIDDNDNAPVCDQPLHRIEQNEDIQIGTPITHIRATDADERGTLNSRIEYFLEGVGANFFSMNKETGVVRTAKLLDRETKPEYRLTAVARDGGGLTCTTSIFVVLKDVNDNPPVFATGSLRETYNIREDAKVRTLLTRVVAQDADTSINSHIRYKFSATTSSVFSIDAESGIISLAAELDREKNPYYNLTVIAYNPVNHNMQELSSEVTLMVTVLDVNDNPPEFERSSYFTSIDESARVGAVVERVKATSLDVGLNADITYAITAGNEHGKFAIDQYKGVVTVAEPLDHELSREYFITVLATDRGTPPLTNTAIISINITDINDNPPRFSQDAYTIHVLENVKPGSQIFKVMATDSDSLPNAIITYSLVNGNNHQQFKIDEKDGSVKVIFPLDREKTSSYSLVVQAQDSGAPTLFSSAVLSIIVDDVNDNPPVFTQDTFKGLVQKTYLLSVVQQSGVEVATVSAVDADLPENGPPFYYEIVEGNDNGEFHIDNKGVITTAGKLLKQVKERYILKVRAHDNGKPSLSSNATVDIEVVDDSLFPPEVSNLSIHLRSCMDSFLGGVIGILEARDRDPHDKTIFTIVSPNSHLFNIHRDDGRLIALTSLDGGNYIVNVSVSDGKFTTYGRVDISVLCTTKDMVENGVTIQFQNLIEEQFHSYFKQNFQRVVKQELDVRSSDVEIINVQPSSESVSQVKKDEDDMIRKKRNINSNLDVLFAVRKTGDKFYGKRVLKKKIEKIKGIIEAELGTKVVEIFTDRCAKDSCQTGTCVGEVKFDAKNVVSVQVKGGVFVSARHQYHEKCECLGGECGEVQCGDKKCSANKICIRNGFRDYICQCPEGLTGEFCEQTLPLCSGSKCPIERPMTFAGKSYAKWRLEHTTKKRFSLSFRVRTRQRTAVLMHAKGQADYSMLKIERGNLVYKYNCGSGEGQVRIPVDLSDGQWHTVQLDRNGKDAELALDSAYTARGVAPGALADLNIDPEEIFFGAKVDLFPGGYKDISQGFEGCMEGINVFDVPLPLSGDNRIALALEFVQIEFHCQDYSPPLYTPDSEVCRTNPCLNGGRCNYTGPNSYVCVCTARYKGEKCELDQEPCLDTPCSYGGRCEVDLDGPNSYSCYCKDNLEGARCTYGKFCLPNPCKHGGTCIEGPTAPLCDCMPGYQGLYCDKPSDPCLSSPCLNGAMCLNVRGSYQCNCSAEFHGRNCEHREPQQMVPERITESKDEWHIYVPIISGIILIVLIIVLILVCKRRQRERWRGRRTNCGLPESGSEGLLSSMQDKRCKLSNPDLSKAIHSLPSQPPLQLQQLQPVPPPVPTRPASYTPSTHDSVHVLNNLDSAGNYGSAADELETSGIRFPTYNQYVEAFTNPSHTNPAHFMIRNTPPPPSSRASESDSIQKAPWEFEYPNILENYMEADKKQNDKLAKQMPGLHSPQPSPSINQSRSYGRGQGETSSVSSFQISESEDDMNARRGKRKGYHWDTSDWAPGPSMPNISELPTNEILDSPSSSQPSDDCNANADNFDDNVTTMAIYNGDDDSPLLTEEQRRNNIDPINLNDDDDDDDNVISSLAVDDYFEDSEYVGDSEYAENEPYDRDELPPSYAEHPKYEQLLQELNDSYELPASLNIHPNHYLPNYNLSHQELDLDPLTEDENTEGARYAYGTPRSSNPNRASANSLEGYVPLRPPKEFMTPGYQTDGYTTDQEPPSRTSFIDDMSMSMGGFTSNASCSDISGLCEIDDSEVNLSDSDDENTPLNREHMHTQTQV
ncbi:protocadherin Fat 1-like isoform X3 [Physella acuta]|uniref:protocadherin Fat 1-like isoform X3 n=1 Tax=Physella acuta TaxID=109671 RepID=UPI0027DC21C7|nr:protocadherin Fat 1-like isoform X3 [Physella acuta]